MNENALERARASRARSRALVDDDAGQKTNQPPKEWRDISLDIIHGRVHNTPGDVAFRVIYIESSISSHL